MNKKSKFFVIFTVLSLLLFVSVPAVLAGPAPKVDVCHLTDAGAYILINISENAFPAHLEHGDAGPGELVPGMAGKMFTADCSVVDANANVAGTWRGQSGIAGTMGYWFYMYLSQDAAGNVTGTVNYDVGIVRTVTGTVAGNNFTFLTSGGGYWADCTPCTVSVGGTYFHGYGIDSSSRSIEWEANK